MVYPGCGPDGASVDPARPVDFDRLLGETAAGNPPLRGIVYLWALETAPAEAGATRSPNRLGGVSQD